MAVTYEKRNHIAYITLNSPEKANVLDQENVEQISQAWKDVWDDRDVRVAILTAAGERHFCGGHNLAAQAHLSQEERQRLAVERIFWPASGTVNGAKFGLDGTMGDHYPRVWKPVIAAINGWAVGAGFYLMLSTADIRLACAEHARFRYVLLSQGWVGAGPGAALLARQIAYADAMRILVADEPFDAKEALRINLINEVVPHDQLMSRAEEIAHGIAKLAPVAVRMMKEFAVRYREAPIDQAWHVQHLMNSLVTQLTTDPDEGRKAFREKRAPDYSGGLRYLSGEKD